MDGGVHTGRDPTSETGTWPDLDTRPSPQRRRGRTPLGRVQSDRAQGHSDRIEISPLNTLRTSDPILHHPPSSGRTPALAVRTTRPPGTTPMPGRLPVLTGFRRGPFVVQSRLGQVARQVEGRRGESLRVEGRPETRRPKTLLPFLPHCSVGSLVFPNPLLATSPRQRRHTGRHSTSGRDLDPSPFVIQRTDTKDPTGRTVPDWTPFGSSREDPVSPVSIRVSPPTVRVRVGGPLPDDRTEATGSRREGTADYG